MHGRCCLASRSRQDFFDFEVGDGGVGQAGVDLGGSIPGDCLVRADVVVVLPVRGDLVDEFEPVVDFLAEQPFVRTRVRTCLSSGCRMMNNSKVAERNGPPLSVTFVTTGSICPVASSIGQSLTNGWPRECG